MTWYNSLWLWRWLPHRLSKRQSLSTTTVLFRTTFTRTIKLNLLNLLLMLFFSTRKHLSMTSRAILSNFFEEQWIQNHPQYLSGLSNALFRQPFSKKTFLACTCKFCFPISDRVMVPQRTGFFFKFRLVYVHPRAYVCTINEKTKGKFRGEHRVVWIGKTKHTR